MTSPPTQVDSTKSRDRKDQKPQKRQRQKPVPQGRREQKSEEDKTFIIEAPQIRDDVVDTAVTQESKEKEVVGLEKAKPAKRVDQDEAIRREIQKLKLKQQKRVTEKDEEESLPGKVQVRHDRRGGEAVSKSSKAQTCLEREKRYAGAAAGCRRKRMEQDRTVLKIHEASTVADIADGLGVPANELITKLIGLGVMATINQRLDLDTIQIIADEYGFEVEQIDLDEDDVFARLWTQDINPENLVPRPPVLQSWDMSIMVRPMAA